MADMTREEMEQLIRQREGVLYDGRAITSIKDLPTEAELAKGDKAKEAAAKAALKEQLRGIASQLAMLEMSQADATSDESDEESENLPLTSSKPETNTQEGRVELARKAEAEKAAVAAAEKKAEAEAKEAKKAEKAAEGK